MHNNLPHSSRIITPLAVLLLVLVAIMPRMGKFNFDYRRGSPWQYETLISRIDFPILKTREQIEEERERAGKGVVPYFRYSDAEVNGNIRTLESLDFGEYGYLKPAVILAVRGLYANGIMQDGEIRLENAAESMSDEVLFIQKDKHAKKYPVSEVLKVSSARDKILADMSKQYTKVNLDSLFIRVGVYDVITPNLLFDKSATELVHAQSADYISPTQGYVGADQIIVSKGEIVTAEIAQILDSYKAEYDRAFGYEGPGIFLWFGNILLALSMVLILYLSIWYTNPLILADRNRYLYLLFVFLIASASAIFAEKLIPEYIYLIPFPSIALFMLAFFQKRVVLPVYIISLLPLLIFSGSGVELFTMYLTAGVVTIYVFQFFNRGWQQFITALIAFAVIALVYCGFRLTDVSRINVFRPLLLMFFGSMLSVAAYPLIYLFEKLFNLVSTTRLVELSDTNNALLQELAHKAPGTFQHCLQVMNMAEAAARAVNANVELVRAGALYHDIGKMRNPLCFIENETAGGNSVHYHSGLSPKQSARDIIRHVPDGIETAVKYGLPDVLKDFILSHHGTSSTGYFYNRYLNDGGDPDDVRDFFYDGFKPETKEQVILMLCDSIEAASRTVKDSSPNAYSNLVDSIVDGKNRDGQFENADISIRDFNKVTEVIKSYLLQLYHERVEYPNRRK